MIFSSPLLPLLLFQLIRLSDCLAGGSSSYAFDCDYGGFQLGPKLDASELNHLRRLNLKTCVFTPFGEPGALWWTQDGKPADEDCAAVARMLYSMLALFRLPVVWTAPGAVGAVGARCRLLCDPLTPGEQLVKADFKL